MISGVLPADVEGVWPSVLWCVSEACMATRGKYQPEDFKAGLMSGHLQLWLSVEGESFAVWITEIVRYPRLTVCQIRVCDGRGRDDWQDDLSTIEQWAKAQGCNAMELIARPGWKPYLKTQGYDYTHCVMERSL